MKQPLLATNTVENYDIVINLDGGGIKGQAEAARLGIARALCEIDAEMRPVLKKAGFLTRDPREVERKSRTAGRTSQSSSSVSVNPYRTDFRHARRGFQIRKDHILLYMSTLQIAPSRKTSRIGLCHYRGVDTKRIKIKKDELKCHVQILIHCWRPAHTSVT